MNITRVNHSLSYNLNENAGIYSRNADTQNQIKKISLSSKASLSHNNPPTSKNLSCPVHCLNIIKDDKWMSLINDLFSAASHICSLVGTVASKFVPYLTIFSAPVRFHHAVREAHDRVKLMACAFRTAQVANIFFWAGRGIGSIGEVLSDVIKPFAGGFTIVGLTNIPALGFTFSFVMPVILIVLSSIGASTQGWVLLRIKKAKHKFNLQKKNLNGSLANLELVLHYLQGPVREKSADRFALQAKDFSENHFTDSRLCKLVQQRIGALLSYQDVSQIHALQEKLFQAIPLISQSRPFTLSRIAPDISYFQSLDQILTMSEEVLVIARQWQSQERSIVQLVKDLEHGQQELLRCKEVLYKEGVSIIDSVDVELGRKLNSQIARVVATIITLCAGILFLTNVNPTVAYSLALSSAVFDAGIVIYCKKISRKRFVQTEEFQQLSLPINCNKHS